MIARSRMIARKTTMKARSNETPPARTGGRARRTGASTGSVIRQTAAVTFDRTPPGTDGPARTTLQSSTARTTSSTWNTSNAMLTMPRTRPTVYLRSGSCACCNCASGSCERAVCALCAGGGHREAALGRLLDAVHRLVGLAQQAVAVVGAGMSGGGQADAGAD